MSHSQMCRSMVEVVPLLLFEAVRDHNFLHGSFSSGSQTAVPQKTWPDITLLLGIKLQKISRCLQAPCDRQNKLTLSAETLEEQQQQKTQQQLPNQTRTKEKLRETLCFLEQVHCHIFTKGLGKNKPLLRMCKKPEITCPKCLPCLSGLNHSSQTEK